MRSWLIVLVSSCAYAHVVSMSSGELHVDGRMATYELRIPMYEVAHVANPETALLEHVKFGGARRTSSSCMEQKDTYVCRASYEFDGPVPDKIDAECTLFEVTVPNHVHLLYAVQGTNSDQEVFDQTFRQVEVRFHPPSRAELIAKDGAAGIARLFKSVSGLLFLAVLLLAARSTREAGILALAFLAGEWLARPLSPHIPLAFSPEFLEALLALTVAYLAAEIVLLPDSQARWAVVPVLGVAHGLAFAPFPPLYLTAAQIVQVIFLALPWILIRKIPTAWRRPGAVVLLIAAIGWFARMLV